jgi:hypothetical protein
MPVRRHSFCKKFERPSFIGCGLHGARLCACSNVIQLRFELRNLIKNATGAGIERKGALAELAARGFTTPDAAEAYLKRLRREWGRP